MSDMNQEEITITSELLKEVKRGNYFCAFNPVLYPEKDLYNRNIRLIQTIYDVLNEYHINKCSHGYTYIKDAVCIITDLKTMDVCLINDVYPQIAYKYRIKDISSIEHDIRNSISAAFKAAKNNCPDNTGLLKYYSRKPSNKTFLLDTVQKVGEILLKEQADELEKSAKIETPFYSC